MQQGVKVHTVAIGYTRGSFKLEVRETVNRERLPFARAHAAMDRGLNEEFKFTVAEMKPHARKLPQKSSKEQSCLFLNIAHHIISVTIVKF